VQISAIRKALGADKALLRTASGRGYRLLGGWTARQEVPSRTSAVAETGPPFATGSGTTFRSIFADLIGRDKAILEI
jgi:hypothetical protein